MIRGGILRDPAPLLSPVFPPSAFPRKNSPSTPPPAAFPRKNSPSTPENADLGPFFVRWANFCAHRTRPRANFETNNTSVATDAGQHETAGTTARPQTATIETTITSAPEYCTKNARFSPAKAMAVSVEARPAPAKVTGVSDNRPSWPTGPGDGARGRRRGLSGRRVGGRRYKRRQTNAIQIASRGPPLQTSSI